MNLAEEQVPKYIKQQVEELISLLLEKGIDYEQQLAEKEDTKYQFLFPKSKYYRYYTHQLFQHGPTSREKQERDRIQRESQLIENERLKQQQDETEKIKLQGTVQAISVGAMCQIVKEQLRQGKRHYQPFDQQIYIQEISFDGKDKHLAHKYQGIIQKYGHLIQSKKIVEGKQTKDEVRIERAGKFDEFRKQIGGNNDGSMGVYGGKKYQGLGVRDEFANFRRERSQNYYSGLQEKIKQSEK